MQPAIAHEYGEGAPLLLLHAFPLNHHMWQPQLAVLGHRYHVLAVDYAGFGTSYWAPTTPADINQIDDLARHIITMLDEYRIESVAVAGLSMGGYLALALWRVAPNRINRLALCNTRAAADDQATKAARSRNAAIALEQGSEAIADIMLPRLLSEFTGNGMKRLVRDMAASAPARTIANALLMMRERPDATSLLPHITVPTLVIGATHDPIIPADESRAMADRVPNGHALIIDEVGHLSNLERPDIFNAAIINWMQRVT
jgi:pimeloyl-ACP methyl ester carboxylesterase